MVRIYVSTPVQITAGGTASVPITNPTRGAVRVRHIETVVLVDETGAPGAYEREGIQYAKGRITYNDSEGSKDLPTVDERPLALWADDRAVEEYVLPNEGATLNLTNDHPSAKLTVHMVLHCDPLASGSVIDTAIRRRVR